MEAFINGSYLLQSMLVAGFLAFAISNMGKQIQSEAYLVILKILTFGLFAQGLATLSVEMFIDAEVRPKPDANWIIASVTIFVGLVIGAAWRGVLNSIFSWFMGGLGVYYDDHEGSAWDSICSIKKPWSCLHIYMKDGSVLESNVSQNDVLPISSNAKFYLNRDGLAVPVTGIERPDGTEAEFSASSSEWGQSITYIPMAEIIRIQVTIR